MLYHAVSLFSEPEWLCKWVCPINFSSLGDTGATHEKLFKWIRFSPFFPSLSGILFVAEKIEQIGPFERCHPPGMVYFLAIPCSTAWSSGFSAVSFSIADPRIDPSSCRNQSIRALPRIMSLYTYPSSAISPLVADGAAGLPPPQTSSGRFSVDLAAFEIAWLQPLVSFSGILSQQHGYNGALLNASLCAVSVILFLQVRKNLRF